MHGDGIISANHATSEVFMGCCMGRLSIISSSGDNQIMWDVDRAASCDPEAKQAVREAERLFNEQLSLGASAFRINTSDTAEKIHVFDPTADQIVIVPLLRGG